MPPTGTPSDRLVVGFVINGDAVSLTIEARWTLADVIRDRLGLKGTHLGCEHGVCGACTVLLDDEPVRSCLVLGVQAHGCRIRTIEELAAKGHPHPLQRAFHERHALQCGFCTPGFLMLAAGLLEREPDASPDRVRGVLSSNLCRCTGYTPILEAVFDAQAELRR
jgi:aerobic carbon-monoxide dehydrogenase small subunit